MPEWENWGKPKPKDEITVPIKPTKPATHGLKRKAIATRIGLSEYGSFMNTPGYNAGMAAHPRLPEKMSTGGTGSGTTPRVENGGGGAVKTSTNANFTGLFFESLPDYSIQEALSLRSLTGNEILQVAHRENFYTTAEVLNKNIIDIVESREFYSPTQIIKLQTPDYSYLFQNNVAAYGVSLASSLVSISIPSSRVTQSAKIQVETFAPKYIKNDTIYT